jgi:hypothetical protein
VEAPVNNLVASSTVVTSTTTTTDETKDWKKYTNAEYGFEVKYPQNWEMQNSEKSVSFFNPVDWSKKYNQANYPIYISIYDNPDRINVQEWYEKKVSDGLFTEIIENIMIDNIVALKILNRGGMDNNFAVYVGNNISIFSINTRQDSKYIDIFEKIISTFKFIDNTIDKTKPSVSSIIPDSGSLGTSVELKGYNLLSNRGEQNIVIENSNGDKAYLGFGNTTHLNISEKYVSMKFDLSEKVCKDFATDAGLPCKSWMAIVPGEYKIYVIGPSYEFFTSNKVNFTIINSSLKIISPNGGETYNIGENIPVKFSINGNVNGGVYMELVDSFGNVVSDNITGLGVGSPDLKDWNGLYNLNSKGLPEGKYKIHISTYGKDVSNVEDYSDSFFTILDNALIFMNRLKSDLKFNQEVIKTTRNLHFDYGINCSGNENLNGYLVKGINTNFESYGFVNDIYNTGDATFKGSSGMRKDSVVCQIVSTYVPENGDSKICFTDPTSDAPNLLICPPRTEFFCADLNQISKDKFKDNCEFRG